MMRQPTKEEAEFYAKLHATTDPEEFKKLLEERYAKFNKPS